MAGSQLVNDILRRLHGLFRRCLNFQSISPHLRQHNLLTDHEWQVIKNKDSHEDQVDEFLNYLPLKGKDCLNQLIECLRSSLDHLGHQDILTELEAELKKQVDHDNLEDQVEDEFEKMVNTISSLYKEQKGKVAAMKTKFESASGEIIATKTKLEEYNHEIISLRTKLEVKSTENREMEIACTDYIRQIEELKAELSTKDLAIADLKAQLQEQENMCLPMQDTSYEASIDEMILHEQPHVSKISLPTFSSMPIMEKRSSYTKELSAKKHPEVNRNVSLEDKVKSYQDNVVSYREQCQTLKEEKAALLKTKQDLENEVTQLRDELEGLSFSSTFSQQTRHSQSCSSLYSLERTERDTEPQVKQRSRTLSEKFLAESKLFASGRSRITSFLKGTAKKTSRTIMPLEALESTSHEASAVTLTLPENINKDYLDPLHQGWLLKEGGQKKYWKKRWCLLSSRFFFYYFEGMEDPSLNKRPTGILPITKEMAVDDSLKENHFAIYNTRKNSMMKSCKLDKSKGNYVQGHHAVYNLQAYSDGEKKKWIEMFQFVFEQLKQ